MAFRSSFARAALIVINLFVTVGGAAVLGIGCWIVYDLNGVTETEAKGASLVMKVGITAIAIGGFVTLIGISGCFGACMEHTCCLILYASLLSITIFLELALGIFSIVLADKIEDKVDTKLMKAVMGYSLDSEATVTLDHLQYALQCCGSTGPSDYQMQNSKNASSTHDVPDTCCKPELDCNPMEDSETIYQIGCTERLVEYAEEYLGVMAGITFAVIVCQVIALIFGICLIRSIRDEHKV